MYSVCDLSTLRKHANCVLDGGSVARSTCWSSENLSWIPAPKSGVSQLPLTSAAVLAAAGTYTRVHTLTHTYLKKKP